MNKIVSEKVTPQITEARANDLIKSLTNQKEIKVRHILVESEKEATEIKNKISKGEKFADLAKKLSKDEASKARGGELGYFMKGQFVPEFEKVAFGLKKAEVSSPVQTKFGWHIILLEDVRAVKAPTKEQATAAAKEQLSQEAMAKYMDDLSKEAEIKILVDAEANKESK